jgi:hypothetical protein
LMIKNKILINNGGQYKQQTEICQKLYSKKWQWKKCKFTLAFREVTQIPLIHALYIHVYAIGIWVISCIDCSLFIFPLYLTYLDV